MRKFNELSKSEIEQAIQESEYLAEVLRSLDCVDNGYNRTRLKQFIEDNSIDTSHIKTRLTREVYEANPKLCTQCGKPIPYEHRDNKFCCSSCATSYNNKGWVRNTKEGSIKSENREYPKCKYCGKVLPRMDSKYCNNTCKSEYEYQEYIKQWKEGNISGGSGTDWISKRIRRYMLEKNHECCELCGCNLKNPYTNLSILQIHHIDGDCQNNNESNLQLLCPNCHAMTDNFGSLNQISNRNYRQLTREAYRQTH